MFSNYFFKENIDEKNSKTNKEKDSFINYNLNNENLNYKGGLVYSEKISKAKSPFIALWKTIFTNSSQTLLLSKLFIRSFFAAKDIIKVLPYKKLGKLNNLTYNVLRSWGNDLLKILDVKVYVRGLENVYIDKNYLFISNHLSPLDIPLIYATIPVLAGFVSNIELSYLTVFSYWMKKSNSVFLKRGDKASEVKALKEIIDKLKKGISLIIFPEGKMSEDGFIKDFYEGGILGALISQKPILPIYIKGTRECLKPGEFNFNLPASLYIDYKTPLLTNNLNRKEKKDFVIYLNSLYKKFEKEFEENLNDFSIYKG
jgi:1-acyl-sn-glycerol-3-phosphate acyltransferase